MSKTILPVIFATFLVGAATASVALPLLSPIPRHASGQQAGILTAIAPSSTTNAEEQLDGPDKGLTGNTPPGHTLPADTVIYSHPAAVAEPATIALFGLGLFVVGIYRRTRQMA